MAAVTSGYVKFDEGICEVNRYMMVKRGIQNIVASPIFSVANYQFRCTIEETTHRLSLSCLNPPNNSHIWIAHSGKTFYKGVSYSTLEENVTSVTSKNNVLYSTYTYNIIIPSNLQNPYSYWDKIVWRIRVFDGLCTSISAETTSLANDLRSFLKSEKFSDVLIMVDGKALPAHRAILAARSEVFAAMLANNMSEAQEGVINIENFNFETVQMMLEFMYTEQLPILSVELADDLFQISDKYLLQSLKEKCSRFLSSLIAIDNGLRVLKLADMCSDEQLKGVAIRFLAENCKKIIETPDWKAFHKQNVDLVEPILKAIVDKL